MSDRKRELSYLAAGARPAPLSLGRAGAAAVLLLLWHVPRPARADAAAATREPESLTASSREEGDREKSRQKLRALAARGHYFDLFGTFMLGDGVRFNNPYRLSHQLGKTGESLSLTAPYFDLAVVAATGSGTGLSHGGRIGWSWAMTGISQHVITPAYTAVLRPSGAWLFYGWLGVPFVTRPDLVVGGELALGATFFVRAGLGATCAIVADGFYGAGTTETRAAFYPVLSGQVGLSVNYEVLP